MRWRWLLLHGNAMPMVFGCVLTLPSVRFFAQPLELIILRCFFSTPPLHSAMLYLYIRTIYSLIIQTEDITGPVGIITGQSGAVAR